MKNKKKELYGTFQDVIKKTFISFIRQADENKKLSVHIGKS